MQKFVLLSIFTVGFLLFVIIMEILSVDHILIKILNMEEINSNKESNDLDANITNFLQKPNQYK
jgi:hypothetical protein